MLPVMMGLIALSVDAGRYLMMHSELQDIADAAALAGAAELDGKIESAEDAGDSAVERAKGAAKAILQQTRWAGFAGEVQILEPIVSEWVDSEDLAPAQSGSAHFVRVTTVTRSIVGTFIRAVSQDDTASTRATATAGSTVVACKVPPIMVCAPGGDVTKLPSPLVVGRLYRLKGGGGAGYDPPASGAFGLLDTPGRTSSGTNEIRKNLGQADPNFCFLSMMSFRKGNAAAVRQAINTRFDMYEGGIASYKPAPNIIKAMSRSGSGNGCKYDVPKDPSQYRALSKGDTETPDTAMGSNAASTTWDRAGYWSINHPTNPTLPSALTTATRYEVYLWELGLHPLSTAPQMPTGVESATPGCYTGTPADANRRVIYAAALDCTKSHTELQLSTTYLKFFITEPATNSGDVFAEYVGEETLANNSGVLHHIVQLYR
jgi:Flp pilus assembly protein TadG